MTPKFAPRCGARAIRKSKALKADGVGALFEVEPRKICTALWRESDLEALFEAELWKICTTLWRESDLEVKIVKAPGARDVFGGSKCFSRGRRRGFDTLQNTRQAQEFVRVAKTLAGVVDLKKVRHDAFRVAGAGISGFVKSMFEASGTGSAEGLQISCHGSVTLQGSFRVAVTGVRMPRLNFFVAGAVLLKHPLIYKLQKGIVILRSGVWSTYHFSRKSRKRAWFLTFKASFLREVSQNSFVALCWSFKASFLKEVSQNSFVSEFPSFIFDFHIH